MNQRRLVALGECLESVGLTCALLERPEQLCYFVGARDAGALWIQDGRATILESGVGLSAPDRGEIGVDAPRSRRATGLGDRAVDIGLSVATLRRRKDAGELALITASMDVVDQALASARAAAVIGANDRDVWSACVEVVASHGARLEGDIGVGPAADRPDANPVGRHFHDGTCAFVDLYPRIGDYFGDATRVFCAGTPSKGRQRAHAVLWSAVDRVAERLFPGTACAELDRLCRGALHDAGLDSSYPHHTGHGVGLLQQEAPKITPDSPDMLVEGDVVAIEPGLYRRGWGGMRVEDAFVVTAEGPERLTQSTRELAAG